MVSVKENVNFYSVFNLTYQHRKTSWSIISAIRTFNDKFVYIYLGVCQTAVVNQNIVKAI